MSDRIATLFAETSLQSLVEQHLPLLFQEYVELYAQWSEVDLTVLACFEGEAGQTWTLVLTDLGLEVESGVTAKALLTVRGELSDWEQSKAALGHLLDEWTKRLPGMRIEPALRLSWSRLRQLEKLSMSLQLALMEVPGCAQTLRLRLDFGTSRSGSVADVYLALRYTDLLAVSRGESTVPRLLSEQRLRVEGNNRAFLELFRALT
ncbi:MAG: hypothetical protein RBU37_20095 [Myxococcota bacterium]|jgi:hypothetical protein|nr:hypothetical protein [Myxococcota bacterium]